MVNLVHNITEMIRLFTEVALSFPGSTILLLFGALLVGVSVLVFGFLALGGIGAAMVPDTAGRGPQRRA
ncbi:hypothetical protein ACFFQF_07225 [Haladaptatus pallidirubidus]|uniref:Uncharacterized protein n=1 Tax=Haladaptatus pallidirubidus TaxID=1008152 RepID=A0AAV3UMK1_9EURY|nr:hypothetical protein [Haladaptatus pallidirubidus]